MCQFSKFIKGHLVIFHKGGMLDDGAICLCYGVRGTLYHLFQWVIPGSFSPFLGCGDFPDDVCQREICCPVTVAEEFINSIESLWPISLINHRGLTVIPIAIRVMQPSDSMDGLDCLMSGLMSLRNLLRVSQVVCCKHDVHCSLLADKCPRLADLLLPPAAPSGPLTFLQNVSTLPSFRK